MIWRFIGMVWLLTGAVGTIVFSFAGEGHEIDHLEGVVLAVGGVLLLNIRDVIDARDAD